MAQNVEIADIAPSLRFLTAYDYAHFGTYLRLLDAKKAEAPWEKVARVVLKQDPEQDLKKAKTAYDSHLARAEWMTKVGYSQLLAPTTN